VQKHYNMPVFISLYTPHSNLVSHAMCYPSWVTHRMRDKIWIAICHQW